LSSFETLILKRVLILNGSLLLLKNMKCPGKYQKGTFLIQKRKNEVGIDKPVEIRKSYEASNKADSGDKERTNQQ
jgi:hypothetical protein